MATIDNPAGTVTFLFTDVVQSSRLWDQHHHAMQAAMAAHDNIMQGVIADHSGVLVKQTGDGVFAVFASAFDAVAAAVRMRAMIGERSWDGLPGFEIRIGLHTGEAEIRDGDYFGATVNRAARVMGTAGPGEVLLSRSTQQVVVDRLPEGLALRDLGERELRGLERPEQVFALVNQQIETAEWTGEVSTESAEEARRAAWIAVLPFENMSGDSEQEYFADGITEDVMTGLAAFRSLRVIARSSSFRYRGSDAAVGEIAEELGAQFILEGSVRKAGNRVRVTAQLIEAGGGHQVWADRYDGDLDDVFELQDGITRGIVGAIDPAIRLAAADRTSGGRPDGMDAWDHMQRGWSALWKYKRESNAEARRHFASAAELDPAYAEAHAGLALTNALGAWLRWAEDVHETLAMADQEARHAVALDDRDAVSHSALAWASYAMGRLTTAARAAARAVELNPSLADAYLVGGVATAHGGDPRSGLELIHRGRELSPRHPMANWFLGGEAISYFLLRENEEAVAAAREAISIRYGYLFARAVLVASLTELGRLDEARSELQSMLTIDSQFGPSHLELYSFSNEADRVRLIAGLRAAGLKP